ncbi:hypothetical protein FA13DRAFT_1144487 [Coprinellus micaceus]|uniref:Uncharacterized protein n=1 Tax=Coprinellus micaceus TaxID=71717 RepID=A0A4Y7RII0_COPMI|nr:hypothetical protein FA13DRAFT_1144487 [Coprinellus micaceus]
MGLPRPLSLPLDPATLIGRLFSFLLSSIYLESPCWLFFFLAFPRAALVPSSLYPIVSFRTSLVTKFHPLPSSTICCCYTLMLHRHFLSCCRSHLHLSSSPPHATLLSFRIDLSHRWPLWTVSVMFYDVVFTRILDGFTIYHNPF